MKSIIVRGRYVRDACRLACVRTKGKRTHDVAAPADYDGPSAAERDFIGMLAEFAAAEHYGLQVDTRPEKDPGYDFVARLDGERVTLDAKGYRHKRPRLLVSEGSVRADYYIHSRVNLGDFSINCAETEYQVSPNEIVRRRQASADDATELAGVSLEENVVVDLLGVATKEMVLEAPVKRHDSDPSHTRRRKTLLSLSELDSVTPFDPHPDRYPF